MAILRHIGGLLIVSDAADIPGGIARGDRLITGNAGPAPGSLSSYLWEASGVSYPQLLERLIDLAIERHREKERTRYSATRAAG